MKNSVNMDAMVLRPYKLVNCGYDFGAPGMKLEIWKDGKKLFQHYSSHGEKGLQNHIRNYATLGLELIRSQPLELSDRLRKVR